LHRLVQSNMYDMTVDIDLLFVSFAQLIVFLPVGFQKIGNELIYLKYFSHLFRAKQH